MNTAYLSIGLDVVILIALGVTIFYAFRLSSALHKFRSYRREFDGLMHELNTHIEHAYEAIRTMKETSNRSADDLELMYHQAKKMADELKIINEASNSVAGRLESATVGGADDSNPPDFLSTVEHIKPKAKKKKKKQKEEPFAIQDREFEEAGFDPEAEGLQSEAEKELYDALKRNKSR